MFGDASDEIQKLRSIEPELKTRVEGLLEEGEEIQRAFPADLSLDGAFKSCALWITDRRLISCDPAHPDGIKILRLDEIEDAEIERMYGNSVLRVRTRGETVEINRFMNTVIDLFEEAQVYIQSVISPAKKEELELHSSAPTNENRCPQCGRPLTGSICPFCIDKRKVIVRMLGYAKPYWKLLVLGIFCSLIATAAGLIPPYLTRILVDEVVLEQNLDLLWTIIGVLFSLYLAQALFGGFRRYFLRMVGEKIVFDLRTMVYTKLQTLSLEYFDRRQTGSIMSRVSNDTQQLQGFILQISQNILIQLLTLLGIGLVMVAMDWQLALLTLLPVPLVIISAKIFSRRIHPIYHRIWRRFAGLNAILGDTIPGIRVIKAFTGENREVNRFKDKGSELFTEQMRAARMASIFGPSVHFFMTLGGLIVWGLGGYWVITQPDRLTLGTLVAFIGYMWRFYAPIEFLTGLADMMQRATTAAERVFEILDADPEPNYAKADPLEEIQGRIEFKNVSFSYERDKVALENIDLTIEPGETVGLVGTTGAGKTTIANLILRYYEPLKGQILLDGKDLMDVDLHSYRENIGYVPQEPLLFSDTIANNIAYSNPEASIEELIEAAIVANAHDFIAAFPDAYDTRIGERGVGLSGGEKQRISIARAVLKDPAILVLDEATSAVDTETEKLIQQAVDRLIQNRTTIIIAHRLSTLRNADKIVVLEDKQIAEMGTHDELMAREGIFYKLVNMQTDMGTDILQTA